MSEPGSAPLTVEAIDALYRDKAAYEIAEAERALPSLRVRGTGDALADVLIIKGEPGADDIASGTALAGADGGAIHKALDALSLPSRRYALCSRGPDADESARAAWLRSVAEAVDPRVIIALDADAGADLAAAFGVETPPFGQVTRVLGRDVLVVDGLEESLADESRKRRVWAQLRSLSRRDTRR